jgi:chemosensory pili system protein ChpA (sensor histidine kinase/response regulator)
MNPTVFIVDDSITVRELLSLSFKKAGFRVEQARDGQEAWERLKSGLFCDLILCDIEMPRMNGLELLDCIQADAKLSSIPIAMITSRGGSKMQRLAAAKGARGYFVKPYIEERLLEASQRLIKGDILLEMATLGEEAEA